MKSIVLEILEKEPKNEKELTRLKRTFAKESKKGVLRNAEILKEYFEKVKKGEIEKNEKIEKLLVKRAIRTMSGIAPVAVLTKPYPCPGKCAYCPNEKDVPTSYLSNEPAVMRAIRFKYNPYKQTFGRLKSLEDNGHKPTKIELIVIGGTWSYLPIRYKYWYIASCFQAANDYEKGEIRKIKIKQSLSLKKLKEILYKEQKKNEKAKYQLVGLTLETRPDYITEKEVLEMRDLGCTRVEIGVQAIDDNILKLNKRGHKVERVVKATKILRDYGFKVTYHLMPGLPGATAERDLEMFKELFNSSDFQPDQIKFYPTVVTKGSLLYRWWKQGKYKPYSDSVLQDLIVKCKELVPKYVRIIRLIRDIPGESIIAGNKITNLRQIMKDRGVKCNCIRCREPHEQKIENKELDIIKYQAGGGDELFLSFQSKDEKTLFGFCRLRLADREIKTIKVLEKAAIIRELHIYGQLVSIGGQKKTQHTGLGRELIEKAEKIAKKEGYEKMVVISGVGVRGYYKKFGYKLQDTYMIKKLK